MYNFTNYFEISISFELRKSITEKLSVGKHKDDIAKTFESCV